MQGRQAKRGGEVPKALPLECKHRREGMVHRRSTKKARHPEGRRAKVVPRSQFAAGATIDCNWSITPGSTNTQAWSPAIGTLNT